MYWIRTCSQCNEKTKHLVNGDKNLYLCRCEKCGQIHSTFEEGILVNPIGPDRSPSDVGIIIDIDSFFSFAQVKFKRKRKKYVIERWPLKNLNPINEDT